MPEKTLDQPKNVSRTFAIGIGVTEIVYLLGLIALAAGLGLLFGFEWSLIASGAILLLTAFYNDHAMNKGNK